MRWAFDRAGTGMALISLAPNNYGRFCQVNSTFCRIVDRSSERVLAMTAQELTHPDDRAEFENQLRRLCAGEDLMYQQEKRYLKEDGTAVWASVRVAYVGSPDGSFEYAIGQVEDITKRRAQQQDLFYRASHDPLTGLPNRTELTSRLQEATDTATRTGRPGAVLFVDLDDFKEVNDRYGHLAGDQALTVVAARLAGGIGPSDMVARLGGDEFLVVADDLTAVGASDLAERLAAAVAPPINANPGVALAVTISIGYAPIPPGNGHPDELIAAADHAMYDAKHDKYDSPRSAADGPLCEPPGMSGHSSC